MVASRAHEYRRRAEMCRSEADKAIRGDDKAAWLRMAEEWLRLAASADATHRRLRGIAGTPKGSIRTSDSANE